MEVTRKEEPELFNEIGEMIIDKSQNEHRRGSTFFVKAIVEFKPEHKQYYPNVQDYYKYVGYWETNEYVRSEDDVDWEEITELTKVEFKTEMVEVKKWGKVMDKRLADKNHQPLIVGKIYSIPRSTNKFEFIKEFGVMEECFRRTSDNSLHFGREFLVYDEDEGEFFVDVFEAT